MSVRNQRKVIKTGNTHGLTAFVELVVHSAGWSSVVVEESFGDQNREILDVRLRLWVSALICGVGNGVLGERGEVCQISRAVNGVGSRNSVGVAIGGDAEQDLVCWETGSSPCLDSFDTGAILNLRTGIVQRSVGTDARGGGPLTLQNELSGVFLV